MNLRKIIMFTLVCVSLITLASCGKKQNNTHSVKVVYEPEGGVYQNCSLPFVQYYPFEQGTEHLIYEPSFVTKAEIKKAGYTLDGWYKVKNTDGTYEDKWDFKLDKVTDEGVTLYACWKKNTKFTYTVCYLDENGTEKTLGSYAVSAGDKFKDYKNLTKKRFGYTAIALKDSENKPWDDSFTHPGGEGDVDIKVYVEFIKGTYAVVRTASDLAKAQNSNIYLAADIDFGGKALSFNNYNKTFIGNGHTISNFTVSYSASKDDLVSDYFDSSIKCLSVSLFGNMKDATIKDVTFDNFTIDINASFPMIKKIYVTPLAATLTNSTIENVTVTATYTITKIPTGLEDTDVVIKDTAIQKDDQSVVTNVEINFTKTNTEE